MDKIELLDSVFERFMQHLADLVPDGIIPVDIKLLQKLDLLKDDLAQSSSPQLTKFFHVVESKEKITLYNEQFAIWIVPEKVNDEAITLVLIALNDMQEPKIELAFSTAGVYNTSRIVLRVLEKLLLEVQENQEVITHFEEGP